MARDDEAREVDETTVIDGGYQAWSAVDPPADIRNPGDGDAPAEEFTGPWQPPSGDDAPTGAIPIVSGLDQDPDRESDQESGVPDMQNQPRDDDPQPDGGLDDRAIGDRALTDGHDGSDWSGNQGPKAPLEPPAPVLVAKGLGLLTKAGWVFKDIDLTLRPASVAAVVGPSGTGRSCLLLALCGRMDQNTGTLTVAGHSFADKPGRIRTLTAVARIGAVAGPEPGLTVRESIDERCLIEDVDAAIGRTRFLEACAALRVTFDPKALVASLLGDQATLLAVALACVRVSAVIVLDDLDRGVSAAMQQTILEALIRLAKTGPTIIASTTDRIPVMDADVVLDLTPSQGATVWHFEPAAAPPGIVVRQIEAGPDDRPWVSPQIGPGPLSPPPPPDPIEDDEFGNTDVIQSDDSPTEDPR